MDIIKTDAIPLRSVKHSESSRIITFFTEAEGIVSLLGKGVRKAKNRTPFDAFSLMNVVYRSKASREIQLLTGAELLDGFLGIRDDLDKSAAAFGVCELVLRTTQPGDAHPQLFLLMTETLRGLDAAKSHPQNYFWFFQLGLLKSLGFGFDLQNCVSCGKDVSQFTGEQYRFSYEDGGLVCPDCPPPEKLSFTLKPEALRILQYLSLKEMNKAERLKASPSAAKEIEGLFGSYLRFHLEGLHGLKSKELLYRSRI